MSMLKNLTAAWRGTTSIAIVAACIAGITETAAAQSLTVVSGGGAYAESQIKAFHEPFSEKTGVTVNSDDYNYQLGPIRAQVEAGNIKWDVAVVEKHAGIRGCQEGLFEPIDATKLAPAADGTPPEEDFIDGGLIECAVGEVVWSLVIGYDKTRYGDMDEKPTTAADFFNLDKFPGKRGLRKTPKGNLEYALVADGVPADEVFEVLDTEEGIDRAFAKLDEIKDQVVWYEAGAQSVQMLASGEVAMTTSYNGRFYNAIVNENQPIEVVWDGQQWNVDMWAILSGTEHPDLARDFIHFATEPEQMAMQTHYISYAPARRSALALAPDEVRPHLPTHPDNFKNSLEVDNEWWADNLDALKVRFNAWLSG